MKTSNRNKHRSRGGVSIPIILLLAVIALAGTAIMYESREFHVGKAHGGGGSSHHHHGKHEQKGTAANAT